MQFDTYYEEIKKLYEESIKTQDEQLRQSLFDIFNTWFDSKYKKRIQKDLTENNTLDFEVALKEIKRVIDLNDYEKIVNMCISNEVIELYKISNEIFEYARKVVDNNNFVVDESTIANIEAEFNKLKTNIPKIFEKNCESIISETYLDLEYIKSKGGSKITSLRLARYIK